MSSQESSQESVGFQQFKADIINLGYMDETDFKVIKEKQRSEKVKKGESLKKLVIRVPKETTKKTEDKKNKKEKKKQNKNDKTNDKDHKDPLPHHNSTLPSIWSMIIG